MSHTSQVQSLITTSDQPTMALLSAQDIGAYAYERRIRLGMSQNELAQKIGVNSRTILRFENGNGANLTSVLHILNELGIELLGRVAAP